MEAMTGTINEFQIAEVAACFVVNLGAVTTEDIKHAEPLALDYPGLITASCLFWIQSYS
jgi:hypothetical protein